MTDDLAELREYLPLLRAIKRLMTSPALDTAANAEVSGPLTAEERAKVESDVQRYIRKREAKR